MENFKEIAEKCLAGELSGTFVTAFDNNWHSSYLQRYAILGHEMPEQYVLGPGVIYNAMGQCESRKEVKIIDFIPDNMQKKIEIDIPEGVEVIQEETSDGIRIKFIKKPLSYDNIENVKTCRCWFHAKKKYADLIKTLNDEQKKVSLAVIIHNMISNIFHIEK